MNAILFSLNYKTQAGGNNVCYVPLQHNLNTLAPFVTAFADAINLSAGVQVVDENNVIVSFYLETAAKVRIGIMGTPLPEIPVSNFTQS